MYPLLESYLTFSDAKRTPGEAQTKLSVSEVENDMLLAAQKSEIVQSDLSATTSSQIFIFDFETPMSQLKKIDIMTAELAAVLDRGKCCARGRPIIVEWERHARHSAGLSLVR
ncbi:hypothetical protein EVAR_74563_1 [Eumeta japonica]|uniref:Uncharacterized protein n=1 Tax=Eumeta variegata TaxID=151549 RepID=A0A4C1TBN5_EUMVA|nr:hypothetical protein EVAR_74563_1 [Eumeta japonica]